LRWQPHRAQQHRRKQRNAYDELSCSGESARCTYHGVFSSSPSAANSFAIFQEHFRFHSRELDRALLFRAIDGNRLSANRLGSDRKNAELRLACISNIADGELTTTSNPCLLRVACVDFSLSRPRSLGALSSSRSTVCGASSLTHTARPLLSWMWTERCNTSTEESPCPVRGHNLCNH